MNNENAVRKDWFITTRNIIYYVLGVIEVLLVFRLVFKLLGANSSNVLVSFLYSLTRALIAPFVGIFRALSAAGTGRYVFEPSTIIAMIVYALIALGLVRLAKIRAESGAHQ